MLRSYLRMISDLLEEKATDLEHDWAEACAAAAEIETLQGLEAAVAQRAVGVQAADLEDVRIKLEIWRALVQAAPEDEAASIQTRLALSIEADIERLQRGPRR